MKRSIFPLAAFALLIALLGAGLGLKPAELPSPLVGKAVPAFVLAHLDDSTRRSSAHDMLGRVWLLNVWASWCASCHQEHGALMDLARSGAAPLVGLAYKDAPRDGIDWLARKGNPYHLSLSDTDGRVGIDFGVYGVPETFVIDKRGIIRLKYSGPLSAAVIEQKLLPLIRELEHG